MINPKALHVEFSLERFKGKSISAKELFRLQKESLSFTIGKGSNAVTFDVVHTDAGFVDIGSRASRPYVGWMADHFDIQRVLIDEKNNHILEINYKEKILRFSFEDILPEKIRSTFFSKGIALDQTYGAHEAVSLYLQAVVEQFQTEDARQVLGWNDCNDSLQWCGTNIQPPMLQYHLDMSEDDYLKEFSRLIQPSVMLQFVICAAASSTLLAYLKITEKLPVTSFGVSLVGTSSTGKTTALQLAASLYSTPNDENVFTPFYGTYNALMKMLGRHHGVPICYDESTIKNDISNTSFVYAFTQGRDKLRLNSNSELKYRNSWDCTALFSSEEYLVDASKDNLGLIARIITLDHVSYTTDSSHSEQIKTFASKNYGYIGTIFSNYLLSADSADIMKKYQSARADLMNLISEHCGLTERLIMNYAMIIITSQLLKELGVCTDTDVLKQVCVLLHNELAQATQPGRNLVVTIFNYICSNYKKIDGVKWTLSKDRKPVKVEILEATFEEILLKTDSTDKKSAVNFLLNEGYIIAPEKNRIKAKISIDGIASYGYRFDYRKVDEAFGPVDDAVYTYRKKYKINDPFSEDKLDVEDERDVLYGGNYRIENKPESIEGKMFLL